MTNLPVTGTFRVTATYGQTGPYWATYHKGIDIVCDNLNIYCTCDGTVRKVNYDAAGWGQYVSIDDGTGRWHIFCHLVKGSVKVSVGQKVNRSTILGTMGATGNVSGVHLHYQLQNGSTIIDPTTYLGIPNKKGNFNSNDFQINKKVEEIINMIFKDSNTVSEWAKDAVNKVSDAGIMVGDAEGTFRPHAAVTREELAAVIARVLKL